MAVTTQTALPTRTASPIVLWHLLSLDAPTVAALWTWFIARTSHVRLPAAAPAAMALAVWILYAADRLLDARHLNDPRSELEARHFFHLRNRRAFLIGIGLATVALAALLPGLAGAAIHFYLLEGALLLAWFLILHATPGNRRLPKEIAVGLFFAAAVFVPTIARAAALRPTLLPSALFFAALCSLNCLFIYKWEHEGPQAGGRSAHASTRLALAHLSALTVVFCLSGVALSLSSLTPRPLPAACVLAALMLLALDRNRHRIFRTRLRAAADVALLTPLLLLPFLR